MGGIVSRAAYGAAGRFIALVWLLPAGVMFLAYLVYIAVLVLKELRKK